MDEPSEKEIDAAAQAIAEKCEGWYDYVVQGCFWTAMARAALLAAARVREAPSK